MVDRYQQRSASLSELTTLRVGGPAKRLVELDTTDELVDVIRAADAAGEPLLVLGAGSNVVVADAGFPGTVLRIATRGVTGTETESAVEVLLAAGEDWDGVCAHAVAEGWAGVEALSGIPGLVGATPIQNVGAYGQEIAGTLTAVRVFDRAGARCRTLSAADCGFGYRTSEFKRVPGRYVVLEVQLRLDRSVLGAPVQYPELARALGIEVGERAPAQHVREAVLALRRGKGMVLDPEDRDTWSAGSFFTNPVLPAAQAAALPAPAPRWPGPDGGVKTSAAWLIEHAGFGKGYGTGPARLSSKHTLALTNRGDATAADLLALAREVRSGVRQVFGVELTPEPVLVGCAL